MASLNNYQKFLVFALIITVITGAIILLINI